MNLQYTYSATQNNGQITQFRDGVSGEQVSYGYDSLNRLISASASSGAWGQSFTYDGFGNLLQKTVTQGSAPTLSVAVDPATNRMVGQSYDANGNLLYNGAVYDALNRVWQIYQYGSLNTEGYAYGPNNERVEKVITANGVSNYYTYLYGVDGCRLGVYQPAIDGTGRLYFQGSSAITPCFGGRMLYTKAGQLAVADRLGSIRPLNGTQTARTGYYPYGEEQPQQSTEDTERFATYYRDSTNLDYAVNRYYSSQFGRFVTPDPYKASAGPENPQSWNRYAYVLNDPINFNDPDGLSPVTLPPVVSGVNCSTTFINYAAQFGETIQKLFDSGVGILGMMSFFEEQGSGSTADQSLWAAMDWTFLNRWSLSDAQKVQFYGSAASVPQTFAATVTTGSTRSQVFTSSGQLTAGFTTQLLNILTGDPNSKECEGLATAFDVAQGAIDAFNFPNVNGAIFTRETGLPYITNPVPGALQFGANGAVPSYNRRGFVQSPVATITDGSDVWVFYSNTPRPPVVRPPHPPRRPL